jgi:hypothetical protein
LQPFLLPPDLKATSRISSWRRWSGTAGAFRTNAQAGSKPKYHPRLMLRC